MVKGKVAYNQKGDTDWSDVNIRSLCNGTTEPAATIDCFKSKLSLVDNWNYAVNECAPHRLNSVSTQNAGRTVAVYRWFHPGDKDWLTITQNELSDSQLQQYGYRDKTVQFYGLTAQTSDTVAVYRWFHPGNKDWLTIAEGEISEDQLRQYGYRDKKFQFYAYKTPRPNTEAVFRWFHPDNKDWLTVRNSEFFDSQLKQKGYTDKKLQFYALTSPNVLNTSNDSTSMPTPNNAGSNETSVLDLSGKWIVTRTAGDGADYDVSIAHSGVAPGWVGLSPIGNIR